MYIVGHRVIGHLPFGLLEQELVAATLKVDLLKMVLRVELDLDLAYTELAAVMVAEAGFVP